MVNSINSLSFSGVENNGGKEGAADFEKAIKMCGYGRFHYGFLLLCGAMFLCVGCQNGINAYILPSAECDLNLTSEQKGLLNVSFLLGGVISSLFWGIFADAYGRRYILLLTLLSDSILSIGGSFSQSFKVLLIFRGLNGFFIGAPGSLVYTYLGEFHAQKQRAKAICYVGFFWTLSWLILPGLAWIIIPLPMSFQFNGILYNSWRLFLAVIGIPTLMVAFVASRYPESPKFLVSQGKTEEALTILRKIYAINSGCDEDEYPIKILLSDDTLNINNRKRSFSASRILMELLKNIWQQARSLASPPLLKYALLCWTIYFANMFGYYGFGLWLPELFNRFENYHKLFPEQSVSVCKLIHETDQQTVKNILINSTDVDNCSPNMDQMVFINSLTINAFCLLGNIMSGFLANRVGRRTIPVTTMLLAGIFGFAIYFVQSSLQILMVSCMFSLMIGTANFVISSIVVDIFPTHVGAVAICMMTCFGRIGAIASNLTFGMLLDISCEVPIFLVGSIVIFGGLLALLLSKKRS
ncbi:synaptic vesicle glycoprotein 2C-like [Apis mellifera caucasica]|uniref:Synaptic vesicle glycoprotein 2C-like n=1 Tax=Apis mellifera TaxID=7460 RepID=A0A7M7IF46_APIME|nr:synaptic vesicle glycoprotein 2C-like [Apis mellifera]KAG6799066.1 synaptic vesicle glycoprotein 2C-like [Apis mellifera caucasica]KAG9432491.1 synaptic vesicle glycoprotein 2C-like [Apis mellifera carnica]|eukprot:XP_016767355.2 synaptic vesicle glycoprotein 2C-like [Apis mellifera]